MYNNLFDYKHNNLNNIIMLKSKLSNKYQFSFENHKYSLVCVCVVRSPYFLSGLLPYCLHKILNGFYIIPNIHMLHADMHY